ncbi:zinc-ribbon domain-containing protein [Methanobrevibacter sp.]|uniref:zinc-ribbon domain-containing protein n=1 Tax=Methanobrevibacter sp. TaxID=66852 RepID=UPI003863EF6A
MSKFCPHCGEELVDSAKFCKSCGRNLENIQFSKPDNASNFTVPAVEKDHKYAIIIAYVLALLIPLFGVFAAVYLLTRNDSQKAKTHGKYALIVAVAVWIISFVLF